MDEAITFVPSAFKHGVTKEAISQAVNHPQYEDLMEDFSDKYLLLGFDGNANLLEVLYNRINENTIRVFHAMPCRPGWRALVTI
ncbi:hypothetical protein [Treponema primitia]|uniref:hypothetical protein n=1 Tax=Treponema primitia TaxID=88058 RepID=UPI000255583F|nr:hypothetical protein [Treponema primitia]